MLRGRRDGFDCVTHVGVVVSMCVHKVDVSTCMQSSDWQAFPDYPICTVAVAGELLEALDIRGDRNEKYAYPRGLEDIDT